MDILAARKKAAEARKNSGQEPAPDTNSEQSEPVVPVEQVLEAHAPESSDLSPEPAKEQPAPGPVSSDSDTGEASAAIEEIELLSFRLGQEEYAVAIDDVKEVLQTRELTPVPNAPAYILGVTSLRGIILPVIDLCRRLGLPDATPSDKSRIVVASVDDEQAGMIVDRVTGVVRIHADAVRPAPETIEHGAEFLRGIARKDERLIILLDIKKAIGG